jgi:hypothetical protein
MGLLFAATMGPLFAATMGLLLRSGYNGPTVA